MNLKSKIIASHMEGEFMATRIIVFDMNLKSKIIASHMEGEFMATRIIVFDMNLKSKINNTNAYYFRFRDYHSRMETEKRKTIMEQHDPIK